MGCETAVSCVATIAGNILGFSAKQVLIVHGMATIRDEIRQVVASVAEQHFGSWVSGAIGFQASLMLALPVASFIGDLVWTCISEAVNSIITITAEILGIIKRRSGWLVTSLITAVRVAAVAIGYFVKCLVCNYAMPFVEEALGSIFRTTLPYLIESHVALNIFTPLLAAGATVCTPTVTIIAADIIGFVVQMLVFHGTKAVLDRTILFDPPKIPPEEKRIPVGHS